MDFCGFNGVKRQKTIDLEDECGLPLDTRPQRGNVIDLDNLSLSSIDEIGVSEFKSEKKCNCSCSAVEAPPMQPKDKPEDAAQCTICLEPFGKSGSYTTQIEANPTLENKLLIKATSIKPPRLKDIKNANVLCTPCGHVFCGGCILQVVSGNMFECPMCRVKVRTAELRQLFV
eukprot:GDKJ01058933.1.p1 GENE.GDKJ01058933.1~~GDKJ01058933.1.p1  ORF type:complete len:173 (-),score=15.02 GDKJ01058933.1:401-919(-)